MAGHPSAAYGELNVEKGSNMGPADRHGDSKGAMPLKGKLPKKSSMKKGSPKGGRSKEGRSEGNMMEFDGGDLRFEQALAQTRMAVCITNPRLHDNPIVFANDAFLELTGYRLREVLGRNCRMLQGARTNREEVAKLGQAVSEAKSVVVELLNYRKDGTAFWNALHIGPIFGEDGSLLYYFGSQWDITEVHAAREGASKGLGAELSQRLRSVFSMLGATLSFTSCDEAAEREPERVGERLSAIGRAYDVSFRRQGGAPLSDIVDTVMGAYGRMGGGAYSVDGPEVSVPEDSLSALALCLHELAMESATSGAWARDGGAVAVSWAEVDFDGAPGVEIRWRGARGADAPPMVLESVVLGDLLATFDGRVTVDGETTRITMPLGQRLASRMGSRMGSPMGSRARAAPGN